MTDRCKVVTTTDDKEYGRSFVCPGCLAFAKQASADPTDDSTMTAYRMDVTHVIPTMGGPGRKAWGYNGSLDRPTFTPSILVFEVKREDGSLFSPRCHSYVIDGRIQFLGDCDHPLKGQTVDLPDVEKENDHG